MSPGYTLGDGSAVLAFDVGGTQVKSAIVDKSGAVHGVQRTVTPRDSDRPAAVVVEGVVRLRDRYACDFPDIVPHRIGLSVPGIVDERSGAGVFSSNLGWRDANIRTMAEQALGIPVAFGHDVRSAAIAEHRLGAARGRQDVVFLAIGTGVSGAIIVNGHLHTGGGFAGEFGHTASDSRGEPCRCGAVGCLETVASAAAIARRYADARGLPVGGARAVLDAAHAGDKHARKIWADAIAALALELASISATIAPQAIVIGGGLSRAGDELFEPLRTRLDALLSFHRRPSLLPAALGEDAGLYGTALIARDLHATGLNLPDGTP